MTMVCWRRDPPDRAAVLHDGRSCDSRLLQATSLALTVSAPGRIRRFTPSSRAITTESTSAAPNSPAPNPDKYADEHLDAYVFVEDADTLYAEYVHPGVWSSRAVSRIRRGTLANSS